VKDFAIMPEVELFNGTLRVSQGNGTLWVQLGEDRASPWLSVIAIVHTFTKLALLASMVRCYRAVTNRISLSLVYAVVGFELQANTAVISIFQAAPEDVGWAGIMLGFLGWGLTLCVLFALP
jgi:hypothetical protein